VRGQAAFVETERSPSSETARLQQPAGR